MITFELNIPKIAEIQCQINKNWTFHWYACKSIDCVDETHDFYTINGELYDIDNEVWTSNSSATFVFSELTPPSKSFYIYVLLDKNDDSEICSYYTEVKVSPQICYCPEGTINFGKLFLCDIPLLETDCDNGIVPCDEKPSICKNNDIQISYEWNPLTGKCDEIKTTLPLCPVNQIRVNCECVCSSVAPICPGNQIPESTTFPICWECVCSSTPPVTSCPSGQEWINVGGIECWKCLPIGTIPCVATLGTCCCDPFGVPIPLVDGKCICNEIETCPEECLCLDGSKCNTHPNCDCNYVPPSCPETDICIDECGISHILSWDPCKGESKPLCPTAIKIPCIVDYDECPECVPIIEQVCPGTCVSPSLPDCCECPKPDLFICCNTDHIDGKLEKFNVGSNETIEIDLCEDNCIKNKYYCKNSNHTAINCNGNCAKKIQCICSGEQFDVPINFNDGNIFDNTPTNPECPGENKCILKLWEVEKELQNSLGIYADSNYILCNGKTMKTSYNNGIGASYNNTGVFSKSGYVYAEPINIQGFGFRDGNTGLQFETYWMLNGGTDLENFANSNICKLETNCCETKYLKRLINFIDDEFEYTTKKNCLENAKTTYGINWIEFVQNGACGLQQFIIEEARNYVNVPDLSSTPYLNGSGINDSIYDNLALKFGCDEWTMCNIGNEAPTINLQEYNFGLCVKISGTYLNPDWIIWNDNEQIGIEPIRTLQYDKSECIGKITFKYTTNISNIELLIANYIFANQTYQGDNVDIWLNDINTIKGELTKFKTFIEGTTLNLQKTYLNTNVLTSFNPQTSFSDLIGLEELDIIAEFLYSDSNIPCNCSSTLNITPTGIGNVTICDKGDTYNNPMIPNNSLQYWYTNVVFLAKVFNRIWQESNIECIGCSDGIYDYLLRYYIFGNSGNTISETNKDYGDILKGFKEIEKRRYLLNDLKTIYQDYWDQFDVDLETCNCRRRTGLETIWRQPDNNFDYWRWNYRNCLTKGYDNDICPECVSAEYSKLCLDNPGHRIAENSHGFLCKSTFDKCGLICEAEDACSECKTCIKELAICDINQNHIGIDMIKFEEECECPTGFKSNCYKKCPDCDCDYPIPYCDEPTECESPCYKECPDGSCIPICKECCKLCPDELEEPNPIPENPLSGGLLSKPLVPSNLTIMSPCPSIPITSSCMNGTPAEINQRNNKNVNEYNNDVTNYNNDIANISNKNNAIESYNADVDIYNSKVDDYNNNVDIINGLNEENVCTECNKVSKLQHLEFFAFPNPPIKPVCEDCDPLCSCPPPNQSILVPCGQENTLCPSICCDQTISPLCTCEKISFKVENISPPNVTINISTPLQDPILNNTLLVDSNNYTIGKIIFLDSNSYDIMFDNPQDAIAFTIGSTYTLCIKRCPGFDDVIILNQTGIGTNS